MANFVHKIPNLTTTKCIVKLSDLLGFSNVVYLYEVRF